MYFGIWVRGEVPRATGPLAPMDIKGALIKNLLFVGLKVLRLGKGTIISSSDHTWKVGERSIYKF